MKTCQKSVLALTLAPLLSGGVALASPAWNDGSQATGPTARHNLPIEVHYGSFQMQGEVVEVQYGNENGSLIWEATQQDIHGREFQPRLEASDGYLVAEGFGEHQDENYENRDNPEFNDGERRTDEWEGRDIEYGNEERHSEHQQEGRDSWQEEESRDNWHGDEDQ